MKILLIAPPWLEIYGSYRAAARLGTGGGGSRVLTHDCSRDGRCGDPVIEVDDLSAKAVKRLQSFGLLYFYLTPRRMGYNVRRRAGVRAGLVNALGFLEGIPSNLFGRKQ